MRPVTIGPSFRAVLIPLLCMQPSAGIIVTQSGNTLPTYDRRYPAPGGIAGVRGNADIRRFNELYDAYLRAGEVCLEARGYQVTR